jgi:hypothetical protein
MKFSKEATGLRLGNYYLLKAPLWSDSGYVIAECVGSEMGQPVFANDMTAHEIPFDDIEGWAELSALNVA